MKLRDIDPDALASDAHDALEAHCRTLAFALGCDLTPGGAVVSEARHAVHALAVYARDGIPPEGRPELVHEYLISLIPLDLLPRDVDPPDLPPDDATDTALGVHTVVLAVLAREALRQEQPVPSAQLAALASVTPAAVRHLLGSGELRRWRAGAAKGDRRAWVHPEDARRWLAGRGVGLGQNAETPHPEG